VTTIRLTRPNIIVSWKASRANERAKGRSNEAVFSEATTYGRLVTTSNPTTPDPISKQWVREIFAAGNSVGG